MFEDEDKVESQEESEEEEKGGGKSESKHDKFKRLATKRMTNAIKKIELIGHLSSSSYESAPEEVEKIFTALQQTLDNAKSRFSKTKKEGAKGFTL